MLSLCIHWLEVKGIPQGSRQCLTYASVLNSVIRPWEGYTAPKIKTMSSIHVLHLTNRLHIPTPWWDFLPLSSELLVLMSQRCQWGRCLFRLMKLKSGFAPCSVTNRSGALTQFEGTQQRIPSWEGDIASVIWSMCVWSGFCSSYFSTTGSSSRSDASSRS